MDKECPHMGIPRDMNFAATSLLRRCTTFHVKHTPHNTIHHPFLKGGTHVKEKNGTGSWARFKRPAW